MRKVFFIIFLIPLIIAGSTFFSYSNYALDETAEVLKLYLGKNENIPTSNPTRIAIGNPEIVDVVRVTKQEITLSPKAAGITTLVFWDNFGEQSYKIRVFAEDMNEIKSRIDNILEKLDFKEVYTKAVEGEGKVMLLGRVKTPQQREKIATALGPLKDKAVDLIEVKEEETAVEIDVQVLELNKGATDTLGFTWPGSITVTEQGYPTSTTPVKFSTLFDVVKYSRTNFEWKLDALIQEGKARVLSRPRLTCQSNKEAKLLVGGEVPILSALVSYGGTTSTAGAALPGAVEYKEYGIILKIKPVVSESGRIHLNLDVEVSEVGTAVSTTYAYAYPFTKRTATTELFLDDGQTLAIGGLIKQKTEDDLRKFPWLADLPVLGMFFRQRTYKTGSGHSTRGDTELFITLTPNIVKEKEEAKEAKKEVKPRIVSPVITGNLPEPLAGYAQIIQKRIIENLDYPSAAKQAGFQGTVKLSLHLSYRGELLDVMVKDSSGYQILDDNAASSARSVSTYPPFPPSIKHTELWIDVPIDYRLD